MLETIGNSFEVPSDLEFRLPAKPSYIEVHDKSMKYKEGYRCGGYSLVDTTLIVRPLAVPTPNSCCILHLNYRVSTDVKNLLKSTLGQPVKYFEVKVGNYILRVEKVYDKAITEVEYEVKVPEIEVGKWKIEINPITMSIATVLIVLIIAYIPVILRKLKHIR